MAPSLLPTGGSPSPDTWERVKAVFLAALDVDAAERIAFVRQACDGDEEAACEVLSLLERDRLADSFCETPAVNLLHPLKADESTPVRLEPGTRLGAYEVTAFIG